MKKIIFTLLGCSLLALASCNKTESIQTLTPTEIVGDYTGTKLSVIVNGSPVSASSVIVEGTVMAEMTVKLPAGIAGAAEAVVKPVIFSQGEGDVCKLSGKAMANGYDIVVDGTVLNNKLNLSVFVKLSPYNASNIIGVYNGSKAAVKVSGVAYDLSVGQEIEILGTSLSSMTVKVPAGVVPGENLLEFSNVVFTTGNDCGFTGTMTNAERTLNLVGSYTNGNITISITPEYKTALVGIWNFEGPNISDDQPDDISRVMLCNVETLTGKVKFFFGEQDASYMDVFFNGLVGQGILRSYHADTKAYTGALKDVTFHADGNLTAEYNTKLEVNLFGSGTKTTPNFVKSPMGAMRWYIKDGKLFLVPNLNMMTKGGISSDGLPLEMILKDNKVTLYATKEQVMPLMSLINPVIQGLPDSFFGEMTDMAGIAKVLVSELAEMTKEATRFDLGICFEKAKTK